MNQQYKLIPKILTSIQTNVIIMNSFLVWVNITCDPIAKQTSLVLTDTTLSLSVRLPLWNICSFIIDKKPSNTKLHNFMWLSKLGTSQVFSKHFWRLAMTAGLRFTISRPWMLQIHRVLGTRRMERTQTWIASSKLETDLLPLYVITNSFKVFLLTRLLTYDHRRQLDCKAVQLKVCNFSTISLLELEWVKILLVGLWDSK